MRSMPMPISNEVFGYSDSLSETHTCRMEAC
jgi:hypothetical protein